MAACITIGTNSEYEAKTIHLSGFLLNRIEQFAQKADMKSFSICPSHTFSFDAETEEKIIALQAQSCQKDFR